MDAGAIQVANGVDRDILSLMSKIRKRLTSTFLAQSLELIPRRDKKRILQLSVIQSSLGLLDLAGVASIGMLTALTVNGVQSRPPGDRVTSVLNFLQLDSFSFQVQVILLATLALGALVGRTLLSIWFARKTLRFLSRISANISSSLVSKLLAQPLLTIQKRTTSETIHSITAGVGSIILGMISVSVSLLADLSLLIVLSAGLLFLNPAIALSTLVVFGVIGYGMYWLQHKRATRLGRDFTEISIARDGRIMEVLASYRELIVRDRRKYYSKEIEKQTTSLADLQAEMSFLPQVNKYVVEITVIVGTFLISAVQFAIQDLSHAVSTLAVFSAASARIAPSVIRIQQSVLLMKSSTSSAAPTLSLIQELNHLSPDSSPSLPLDTQHRDFLGEVTVNSLNFSYTNSKKQTIQNMSFEILPGEFVAIVGPSGAGKTTLADLILGVIEPDSGEVFISGIPSNLAIKKWPGAIAYVPQDVLIVRGSVLENVSLGYPITEGTERLALQSLKIAELNDFVNQLPNGLASEMGERGAKISGGQRQRLGLARALFTNPKLLVLDEATSSLDGETEAKIARQISDLRGQTTLIVIAHRLSTVRSADKVIYMNDGLIESIGTFNEVRNAIPDFDKQAALMGLEKGE